MRVLFVTLPVKAHLYAQVPLAWALRAAGHEVRVASQPDMADKITTAGLAAVPVGRVLHQEAARTESRQFREQLEQRGAEVHPWYMEWERVLDIAELRPEKLSYDYMHGVHMVWTLIFQNLSPPDMIDDLVAMARAWRPDLVISDSLILAAPVAARACGAAHARLLYGLDLLGRIRERYLEAARRLPPELRDDPMEEWLAEVLGRYGCDFGEDVVVGQWTIDPVLPSMHLVVDHQYVPVRYVPYNGQARIPGWLREKPKRRRICLTLGLSLRELLHKDRASVATLLEAVEDLDADVVATLNADQLAGARIPGNVRAVDFVPLNELLPSCSAILHQGGFGQMQTALAHRVPQVILPNGYWDTAPRARQLERSGAGLYLPDGERATADELHRMLVRVLEEPSFAQAAMRLGAEFVGMPAPADIVRLIEALAVEYRR